MELWRKLANPWGQEVLIGISWDLMWAALAVGLGFVVLHSVWAYAKSNGGSGIGSLENPSSKGWSLPAKILRHAISERVLAHVSCDDCPPGDGIFPYCRGTICLG